MLYAGVAELADAPALGAGAPACRFKSCHPHHKRNLFCLPRQERFFLAFCAKYKANHRKMGFGAVDWLLQSPIFCFQRQKQSENAGVHIEFLCFASNH